MKNRMYMIGTWLVLIHTAVFLFFWLTNTGFYAETNRFLAKMLGAKTDYMGICLVVSAMLALWSMYRLVRRIHLSNAARWGHILSLWLYAILGVIFVLFFYGSFYMVFDESPIQKIRLLQMLNYFRVILDPLLLLGAALLAADWLRGRQLGWKRAAPIVAILVILWSLALAFPPTPVLRGALADKPLLIAHRGAAALAPENTLAATQLAADMGVFGQETDLHVSANGYLYLMHDDSLERTTNVDTVFPGRISDPINSFSDYELGHLDAGSWFIKDDPFGTVKSGEVTESQALKYIGQKIPEFKEWMAILKNSKQTFIYDIDANGVGPGGLIPAYDLPIWWIAVMQTEDQAWILATPDQIDLVKSILPEAKLAVGIEKEFIPAGRDLVNAGYQVVNAEYTLPVDAIRDYQALGLWINIYTVDEAWQYSRLWILGVDSTTTNQLTSLMALKRPLLSMPYLVYALILVVAGLIAIGINRLRDRSYKV